MQPDARYRLSNLRVYEGTGFLQPDDATVLFDYQWVGHGQPLARICDLSVLGSEGTKLDHQIFWLRGAPALKAKRMALDASPDPIRGGEVLVKCASSEPESRAIRRAFLAEEAPPAEGDGGPATGIAITPTDVSVDPGGNVFIATPGDSRVRRVDRGGTITTLAGNGETAVDDSTPPGPAVAAPLDHPAAVYADDSGAVYIADIGTGLVYKVEDGRISTLTEPRDLAAPVLRSKAYRSAPLGKIPGLLKRARLLRRAKGLEFGPYGTAITGAGEDVLVAERARVLRIDPQGRLSVLAGTGKPGYAGDGGPALNARLGAAILGLASDARGNVYISDTDNRVVRKVDPGGTITTVAGTGRLGRDFLAFGDATEVGMNRPMDLAIGEDGTLFIADAGLRVVWQILPGGDMGAFSDEPLAGMDSASARSPGQVMGLDLDGQGNVYVADAVYGGVYVVDATGDIRAIAGL